MNLVSRALASLVGALLIGMSFAPGAIGATRAAEYIAFKGSIIVETTMHPSVLTFSKWECPAGGVYEAAGKPPKLKISKTGHFTGHFPTNFIQLDRETLQDEATPETVSITGHYVGGHAKIKGTLTTARCNGGKPQAFTLTFFGYS
jgi:hypothetical protein